MLYGVRYPEVHVNGNEKKTRDEQHRSTQRESTVMTVSPQSARVFWAKGEGARTLSA